MDIDDIHVFLEDVWKTIEVHWQHEALLEEMHPSGKHLFANILSLEDPNPFSSLDLLQQKPNLNN